MSSQLVQDCRQIILQVVMAQQLGKEVSPQVVPPRVARTVLQSAGLPARAVGVSLSGQPRSGQPLVSRSATRSGTLPRTGGISGSDAALLGLGASTMLIG